MNTLRAAVHLRTSGAGIAPVPPGLQEASRRLGGRGCQSRTGSPFGAEIRHGRSARPHPEGSSDYARVKATSRSDGNRLGRSTPSVSYHRVVATGVRPRK